MENQEWRPIPKFERYQISNFGIIKNDKGNIVKPRMHHKGYLKIELFGNGKRSAFFIHRIVAQVFIPNPENLPQVNHKKGIKHDNRASELEWCTQSYNAKHSFEIGLRTNIGDKNPSAILSSKEVLEIRSLSLGWCGFTKNMLASKYGVSFATIKDIRSRKSWSHI